MSNYIDDQTVNLAIAAASFVVLLVVIFLVYRRIFRFLKKHILRTPGKVDDFIFDLFKIPALWLFYWILLKIFTHFFLSSLSFFPILEHINTLLLIASITWISIQCIKGGAYYLQSKLDTSATDNLSARKNLTLIKMFKGIANSVIVIVAIAVGLLTFKEARNVGISLLTSAGIAGIIVGLAAQKSIGTILAGVQLAITQPIRLDDVVIVEGEWGRIEEITLTYVVVKIWDERHLVLPVTYFLEKPFQNWTRTSADITGSIFLYVDYSFPLESIRTALPEMIKGNANWDGRTLNVQVTNTTERYKEVRVLVSSCDASKNWDLRVTIREKLIDYINANHPESFARIRIQQQNF